MDVQLTELYDMCWMELYKLFSRSPQLISPYAFDWHNFVFVPHSLTRCTGGRVVYCIIFHSCCSFVLYTCNHAPYHAIEPYPAFSIHIFFGWVVFSRAVSNRHLMIVMQKCSISHPTGYEVDSMPARSQLSAQDEKQSAESTALPLKLMGFA